MLVNDFCVESRGFNFANISYMVAYFCMGSRVWYLFCDAYLSVLSSYAIHSLRKSRELVALL